MTMAEQEIKVLTGLEKAALLAIIADVDFVNITEADSYKCNKCNLIAIYHYVLKCSHVLCGKCHGYYYNKHCPVENCKSNSTKKITQKEFEIGLYNLKVHCTFHANGCKDEVALSDLMVHLSTCQFSTKNLLPRLWTPSPSETLNEDVESLKTKIEDILKTNDEFRTSLGGINSEIATNIDTKLNEFRDDLSFNIYEKLIKNLGKKTKDIKHSVTTIQKKMEAGQDKLSNEVESKLDSVKHNLLKEATEQLVRDMDRKTQELELKMETSKIIQKLTEDQEKLRKTMEEFKETINRMGQQINSVLKKPKEEKKKPKELNIRIAKSYEFSWKISNFSKVGSSDDDKITKEFIGNDAKCKTVAQLSKKVSRYNVQTSCVLCDVESNAPNYVHRTTITILDQSKQETLKHISRIYEPKFKGTKTLNQLSINQNAITENYIKNDSISIKLKIEPYWSNSKYSVTSQTGTLTWKIDNYTLRKQDERNKLTDGIYSNCFLSSAKGYRMKIVARTSNGNDKMSIALVFVNGKFDNSLEQKFPHKATFSILDQSNSQIKKHLYKTVANDNTKLQYIYYPYNDFENSTYLRNDCIIIKVTVEGA